MAKLEVLFAQQIAAGNRATQYNSQIEAAHYHEQRAGTDSLKSLLIDLQTSKLPFTVFAVAWLLLGAILATIPEQIVSLLSLLYAKNARVVHRRPKAT